MELLFLSLIFFVGLITSYTDIKHNKIKNRDLLIAFFIFIILLIFSHVKYNFFNYVFIFVNFFIALIVGFLLFYFEFWKAADAKLFSLYALLIPVGFYSNNLYGLFPSFSILINTFVPFFIVFSFINLFKIRKIPHIKLKDMISIILLFLTGFLFFGLLNMEISFILSLLFSFIFLFFMKKVFEKYIIISLLVVLSLIVTYITMSEYVVLLITLLTLPFILLVYVLGRINNNFASKKIKVKNLKKGLILTDDIVIKNSVKKFSHGLTLSNIRLLKKHFKENEIFHVDDHLALAPFLFFATILTLWFGGDLFSFLFASLS